MRRPVAIALVVAAALAGGAPTTAAAQAAGAGEPFLLGPPPPAPVVVRARLDLFDVNEVSDGTETFEFSAALTLQWRDPRQAFDPAVAGVQEKVFQGDYQFNELGTGWYPQWVLVNVSGLYQRTGVVLRVLPDGTSTQIETVNAAAESEFDMRRFPFDGQRLEAVFAILGFDRDEVVLEVDPDAGVAPSRTIRAPQWTVTGTSLSVREYPGSSGGRAPSSALVLTVDVQRESWFVRRLVVWPLVVIVILSFSVFWMDRASLGDRLSVSFIGILTVVAYQLVTSEHLPRIAYVTLIHAFLNISFLTMCATVVVNLVVGILDRRGRSALGDRIDYTCRWLFPVLYFGLIFLLLAVEFLLLPGLAT